MDQYLFLIISKAISKWLLYHHPPTQTIIYGFFSLQDDQFGGAGGLLKGSAQRLSQVVSSAGSDKKCMCYMILGLVATFFVLYYGLGWIKT